MRRLGLFITALSFAFAKPATAQTADADGEIIEVLPPKEEGEGEERAPEENPGQDSDSSSEWDYQGSSSANWDEGGAGAFQVGLRLGFGLPMGEAIRNADLNEGIIGQIPIWLDVGYKLTPRWLIGLYASAGFVLFKAADAPGEAGCPDNADCSATDVRLGAQVHFFTNPGASSSFWLGAGAGYEWLSTSIETTDSQFSGFEFINGQLGLDFATGDKSAIGPFAAFTVGQFTNYKFSFASQSTDGSIDQTGIHHWLVLGIRGTTDL
ncbi:MAG: hypothetical protein R3B13_17305 [Polyangiaceae bacterium]